MPNIKAAEKWALQSEKRRVRNLDVKTRLKTLVRKARTTADPAALALADSQLDKAAGKGIIHRNKAARRKSRMAKAARTAGTAPAASPTKRR